MRNRFQLEEVLHMLVVDDDFHERVVTFSSKNIVVEGNACESKIVRITPTIETICRSLLQNTFTTRICLIRSKNRTIAEKNSSSFIMKWTF